MEVARSLIKTQRSQHKQEDNRREAIKEEMRVRSAERARCCLAVSPAQKLCKKLQVDPESTLYKGKAMELFHLESFHLLGLQVTEKASAGMASAWPCVACVESSSVWGWRGVG